MCNLVVESNNTMTSFYRYFLFCRTVKLLLVSLDSRIEPFRLVENRKEIFSQRFRRFNFLPNRWAFVFVSYE